jgi:hypothetical protein
MKESLFPNMRNPYRAVYEHFRERRSLEWLTAEVLHERYGGSLDYVKKVADFCVYKKMTAVKHERPHGRESDDGQVGESALPARHAGSGAPP